MRPASPLLSLALTLLTLALATPRASAAPIVSTFGGPHSGAYTVSGPAAGNGPATLAQATPFVPSRTAQVASVRVVADRQGGTDLFLAKILSGAGGSPGAALETYTFAGQLPSPGALASADSASHPLLLAGVTYWLALYPGAPDARLAWHASNVTLGPTDVSLDGGVTWEGAIATGGRPFYEIEGVEALAVPCPGGLAVLALGACVLALRRR